jgi:hypothetical protein
MVVEAVDSKIAMPDGSIVERWTALDTLRITIAEMVRSWGNKAAGIRIAAHLRSGDEASAIINLAHQVEAEQIVVSADAQYEAKQKNDLAADILMKSKIPVHVEMHATQLFNRRRKTIHAPHLFLANTTPSPAFSSQASSDNKWLQ